MGFNRINTAPFIILKMSWIIVILILIFAFFSQLAFLISNFVEYPTSTSVSFFEYFFLIAYKFFQVEYTQDNSNKFPSVTLCNLNGLQRNKFLVDIPNNENGKKWVC